MSNIRTSYTFLFEGQGIPTATSVQTTQTALQDARTPVGAVVLLSCYQAFIRDFTSLLEDERTPSRLTLDDCPSPEALLDLPQRVPFDAIVANMHLYLIQLLRYVANIGEITVHEIDPTFGLLGRSGGMFACAAIACSDTIPQFVTCSTEAFRLAFWMGVHAQQYAFRILPEIQLPDAASQPWMLVVLGSSRADIQAAVDKFNAEQSGTFKVYLTATTHDKCTSVSGRPDALQVFRHGHLPSSAIQSRFAPIYTLYHSPDLQDVKAQVMRDLATHNVKFPSYTDLRCMLHSPVTGEPILAADREDGYTLAEEILDMSLLFPVNFDKIVSSIKLSLSASSLGSSNPSTSFELNFVNVGPGNVLSRSTSRALSDLKLSAIDWSSSPQRTGSIQVPPSATPVARDAGREPIAIVGMAVKFPGAPDAGGLWEVIEKGSNTVSEIPESRFNVSHYNAGVHGSARTLKTKFGNFIDDPDVFDNVFFRVSPREAKSMDPQQRVLLHVAHHALENAGYVPGATPSFNPDTFGTYVGVASNDYVQNLRNSIDVYYSTGTLHAFLSGKISYAFKFSGPSVVVDTACSSSAVAIYQACRALTNGDCNAAIAGGVSVITSPDTYLGLDRAHFLGSAGNCMPWDASADGYCRSEGCGMFVLKRLSDAVNENDNILGVIRGIEVNQSANAASITQPHVPTQIDLFNRLITSAGIEAGKISVIQAHGTGTKAGDPAEIKAIRTVFAQNRTTANPLYITSVKASIGHTEAVSGTAGLATLVLMLRNHTIPATISLKHLNPEIGDLEADGICISTSLKAWDAPADGSKRLALLNNFGAAGSNAALILEEPEERAKSLEDTAPAFVVGISCDSEEAVEAQRAAYIRHLEDCVHDASDLRDFSYTATARRQLYRYRIASAGSTKDEVVAGLRRTQVSRVGNASGKVVFVFSGQGGQYAGMGSMLYKTFPAFRRFVDQCQEKLVSWGLPGVLDVITATEDQVEESFGAFQTAIFVLECALADMWKNWGVRPDAVTGHSLGEYAALVTAEVMSLYDALKLVAVRANLMREKCILNETGMLAVKMSPSELDLYLTGAGDYDQLSVACHNSCNDGVVAGNLTQIAKLEAELKASGRKCVKVNVPYGYHTAAMKPILEDITASAYQMKLHSPAIPITSNVFGTVVSAGDASVFIPEYFARHCGEPVKFEQGIHDLMARDDFATVSTWLELGPHPTSLPMLRSIPATSSHAMYLPTLKKNTDDWRIICESLASLYCGINAQSVTWRKVFRDLSPNAGVIELPAYPFAKTKFWVPFEENTPHGGVSMAATPPAFFSTRFSLLGTVRYMSTPGSTKPAQFETTIDKISFLIEGHQVAGHGLCPASVYVEMASAAAQLVLEHHGRITRESTITLSNIVFPNPLVYSPETARTIRIEIILAKPGEKSIGSFTVASYSSDSHSTEMRRHCTGEISMSSGAQIKSKFDLSSTAVERRQQAIVGSEHSETFNTRTIYDIIFSRIVVYHPIYHAMKSITVDPNGVDAFAVVQLPPQSTSGTFIVHPIFMDAVLHAAGFVVNCNAGQDEAFICSQVDKVKVIPELLKRDAMYGVYCNIGYLSDSAAVGDAYAVELGSSPISVVAIMKRIRFKKLRMSRFKVVLASAISTETIDEKTRLHRTQLTQPVLPPVQTAMASTTAAKTSSMEHVKKIIADTLGVQSKDVSEHEDLERLGLDSLTSIEAHHALRIALATDIPEKLFSTCRTVSDIMSVLRLHALAPLISSDPSTPKESEYTLNDNAVIDVDRAAIQAKVQEVLASVLGMPIQDLVEDGDLECMGMDSLMSIEALHALSTALSVSLPQDLFSTSTTIREVQDVIAPPTKFAPDARSVAFTKAASYGTDINPVLLQDGNGFSASPLFLIHDGSGTAHQYRRLSSLGRRVWGIHNTKFSTGGKWDGGLQEMAGHYTELIKRKLDGASECIVGGWSVGGVIAFEVARRLLASGISVPGLILIDSPHPKTNTPLSSTILDAVFSTKGRLGLATTLVRSCMEHATVALVDYDPSSSPAKHMSPKKAIILRSREGFSVKGTGPNSQSDVFLSDRRDSTTMIAGWESILEAKVSVLDIPGNHFEAFDPFHVGEVSERLVEALQLL